MSSSVSTVAGTGTFEIGSLEQLEAFRDATNSGETFENKTVNLNKDIELKKAWQPISNYNRSSESTTSIYWFKGTFDGKNHTISGLTNVGLRKSEMNNGRNETTLPGNNECTYGLFASVKDAVIKNLKLKAVEIRQDNELTPDGVGALVGYYAGATQHEEANISNITVAGSINGSDNVGGVFGRARGTYFKVSNITLEANSSVASTFKAAGVGQVLSNTAIFDTCVSHANVSSSSTLNGTNNAYNSAAGIGIIWANTGSYVTALTLTGCSCDGTVTSGNPNAPVSQMVLDYSPKTIMETNGTWAFSGGSWTKTA